MVHRASLALVLLVGCSHKADAPAATTGSGAGSGAGSAVVPAAPPPADARAAEAKPAAVVEDPKLRAAYLAGMKHGRKATSAKHYAEAIAAFDEALVAKHNDPRALGERGYARLLEGKDLDEASRDLDAAANGTKDPKLLSQVWFNRGLVEEKRGNALNATAAFVIANQLRPTAAAKAKLAGKPACPVQVFAQFAPPGDTAKPVDGADIVALANAMYHGDDVPPSAAEVWKGFGFDAAPTLPVVVRSGDIDERFAYVVLAHGTGLRAVPVASTSGGRCPGSMSFDVAASDAKRILVHGTEMYEGGYTFMCQGAGDELIECTGKDGEVGAGTACLGGSSVIRDLVIDATTGAVIAGTSQPEVDHPAKVELAADHLALSGLGCERTLPLDTAK